MLRTIFVLLILLAGIKYSLRGPFYILLFYLWNAYFRPEQWMWSNWILSLNLSLVLATCGLATALLSAERLPVDKWLVLPLLFVFQSILSVVLSNYPAECWAYLQEFLKVGIIVLLISSLVNTRERYRLTLIVVGISLGFETAKQGWVQFLINPGAKNDNPVVFLGDNNGVALGMLMLAPALAALATTASVKWQKYLFRFFSIGVFLRALATYSRGGFLAAAGLGFIYWTRSQRKIASGAAIVVIATMGLSVMPTAFWDRMNTMTEMGEGDESAMGRFHYWWVAGEMVKARPLTGVGFNGFRFSYDEFDFSGGGFGQDRTPHSMWFGLLAELGVPGLLCFLALIAQALLMCRRVRRLGRDPKYVELRAYATALESAWVAVVIGGTFLHAQYTEMLWHFIGLGIALGRIADAEVAKAAAEAHSTTVPAPASARVLRAAAGVRPRAAFSAPGRAGGQR